MAVGALLHAAETVERLVLALPPIDPSPGGKVIRLPRRDGKCAQRPVATSARRREE